MTAHAYTQTPREVRRRLIDYACYLAEDETIVTAGVTITPPKTAPATGYVPPAFDQRIEMLDTSGWAPDGMITTFPLVSSRGVSLTPIDRQYLVIYDGDVIYRPDTDFSINGAQVIFWEAPPADAFLWGMVQNPIVAGDVRIDPIEDPPYSAFDVQAYIVAPDNKQVSLVSQGGAAPLTYIVKLLVATSAGQQREVRIDYRVREP